MHVLEKALFSDVMESSRHALQDAESLANFDCRGSLYHQAVRSQLSATSVRLSIALPTESVKQTECTISGAADQT
jgi:hypothetical protein